MTSAFVVDKGIARVRLVSASGTEVLAGLSEGDVVIVAPPPTVTDGTRVTAGGR
jgi:nitrous oxidase accessory protein NosD